MIPPPRTTSIETLEERKRYAHSAFSKADIALSAGTINQAEHDAFLQHQFHTTSEQEAIAAIDKEITAYKATEETDPRKTTLLIAGFATIVIMLFAALFYSTGGITGAVVLENNLNTTYITNTTLQLSLEGATRVSVTGTATGDTIIALNENSNRYVIYQQKTTQETPHATLPKTQYASDEPVVVTLRATENTNITAYLMATDATPVEIVNNAITLTGLATGDYTIKLIVSELNADNTTNVTQESLALTIVAPGTPQQSTPFSTCGEACQINVTGNATLEITTDGTVTIERITTLTGNSAPQLITAIPDVTAVGTARVAIAGAFNDPDGDTLYFDASHHDSNTESVTNGVLTITGPPGTYTYTVYASDLKDLTPSNIFTVTLADTSTVNDTPPNVTINNSPVNATEITSATNTTIYNATLNTTGNITNVIDCSYPDVNLRPIECLTQNATKYFPSDVYLENTARAKVGRLTPLGNLIIAGRAYQHDAGQGTSNDFTIGYDDENGFVPTIWIDNNGDLHTRGSVFEENTQLIPPQGSYSVVNRKGVYLAYADTRAGDLYLRGNLIMFHDVEK